MLEIPHGRRHGESPTTPSQLIIQIDKQVRNQLTIINRSGDRRYDKGLAQNQKLTTSNHL